MNSLWTRCKSLWQAIIHPVDVTATYTKLEGEASKEVWDRVQKAFKHADEAFKEMEKVFDNVKKDKK